MRRTVVLIVLDGWGIGEDNESNPIHVAKPENFQRLTELYPVTSLQASGISVGLPWGEVGNSEVGHLTLGAGKVVYQYYPKITLAVQDGTFFDNPVLKNACAHAKTKGGRVQFVGLLTKANTHAALEHLQALLAMAGKENVPAYLHLFADGLDSPPRSLIKFLTEIPHDKLATLTGRYYAMDRNENWPLAERTAQVMLGHGPLTADLAEALRQYFSQNSSEEFLPPLRLSADGAIRANDAVVFFNFREDGIRQLAEAFINPQFDKFSIALPPDLYVATLTRYAERFNAPVAFPADTVELPLGQVLAEADKTQLRLAETYKYAHVTYFFNGHREAPFPNEYRALVPSLNQIHPEDKPDLMAAAVTDRLVEAVRNQSFDFVLVNYSNPDTIGHTGNYAACLGAIKAVDREIGRVLAALEGTPTTLIITSDHGNIEEVLNPATGVIETQHDKNPVPFYLVGPEFAGRRFPNFARLRSETGGLLSDVAPTVLEIMGVNQPPQMNGRSLLRDLI